MSDDETPPWGSAPVYGTPAPKPTPSAPTSAASTPAEPATGARARLLGAEVIVVTEQSGFMAAKGYQLTTPEGATLGALIEAKTVAGSFFGGAADKYFHLHDADGDLVASMVRPGSFGSRSSFVIVNAEGRQIGGVEQENSFMAPRFQITDTDSVLMRLIGGSFGSREWQLVEPDDESSLLGWVSGGFAGLGAMLRGDDRFVVQLSPQVYQEHWRLLALMATVCLDYVRDERNRRRNRNPGPF